MRTRRRALLAVLVSVSTVPLIAACGGDDDDIARPNEQNIVEITMKDTRYEPDQVEVPAGSTVTFRFENKGDLVHEAFIADGAAQSAHEEEMQSETEAPSRHGEMEHDSQPAEEQVLTLQAGDSGSLEYQFGDLGELQIGCHEPGHWAAGMKARITVTA